MGRAHANRHNLGVGLLEIGLKPARGTFSVLGIHQHVEMRGPQTGNVAGPCAHRADHIHPNAHVGQKPRHLDDVIAVTEAQSGGANQVGGDLLAPRDGLGQMPHDLQEGLVGAKAFLALIAGQVQWDHRQPKIHALGKTGGIILNEFCGTRGPDDQRLRLETLHRVAAGGLEQARRVGPQIAGLKGGVADWRAMVAPFDHGEQKIGIGVALRGVQHIVQPLHASGDPHCPHMGRAFICPQRQLHSAASKLGAKGASSARRRRGRAKSAARSPACS